MPRSLDQERQAIAADEGRLEERRRKLAEAERDEAIRSLDRSGIVRLPIERLSRLFDRVGKLGIDEAERRLAGS